jgi:hypothetical protein
MRTMTRRYAPGRGSPFRSSTSYIRARRPVAGQMAVLGSIAVSEGRAVAGQRPLHSELRTGGAFVRGYCFACMEDGPCRWRGGELAGRSPIKLPESGKVAAMTSEGPLTCQGAGLARCLKAYGARHKR